MQKLLFAKPESELKELKNLIFFLTEFQSIQNLIKQPENEPRIQENKTLERIIIVEHLERVSNKSYENNHTFNTTKEIKMKPLVKVFQRFKELKYCMIKGKRIIEQKDAQKIKMEFQENVNDLKSKIENQCGLIFDEDITICSI